ncbi:MAG: hypothetical protein WKF37_00030 [Bryobacteraceae bacterium]
MKLLSGNTDYVAVTFLALVFTIAPMLDTAHARFKARRSKIIRIESAIFHANQAISMEQEAAHLRCIRIADNR